MSDVRDLDRQAVLASAVVAAQLGSADLARPTPCEGWLVADLLAHMIAQHRGFAAASAGRGADPSVWEVHPLGGDPAREYADASDAVIAAFAEPGVLDGVFRLPEISPTFDFPAAQAISFHFIDYVTHGWDLAKALGVPFELGPDVLDAGLEVAMRVPTGDARLVPGAAFRPVIEVAGGAADADVLDRILRLLGRSPGWPAA